MNYLMRELRDMTGLTQKAFADRFGIPLSTLRKWEQGEASPAGYVVNLIASKISAPGVIIRRIPGLKDTGFYYNPAENTLSDGEGNVIHVCEDLALVKQENLSVYITE